MWRRAYSIDGVHQPARDFGSELHRIDTQFRARLRLWVGVMLVLWVLAGLCVWAALPAQAAPSAPIYAPAIIITPARAPAPPAMPALPAGAARWRGDLVRASHAAWGLDAPIPVFAAQVHQESEWRADAVSPAGAVGMAQFMPDTSSWWCRIHKMSPAECQPRQPVWALRALVGYDRWLWDQIGRIPGAERMDPASRMWATLRAYNGGLGHWQAEARAAGSLDRLAVDAACGRARRHRSHCAENLGYPQHIMVRLQPRYAAWGPVLDLRSSGGVR